jgi:Ca2+-binding RTX toxin-like protein
MAASSFIFSGSALAGTTTPVPVPGNQTISYDNGTLTWTGGTINTPGTDANDSVEIYEDLETAGTVTAFSSTGKIDVIADTSGNCIGTGTDTVTCPAVTSVVANADDGNDTVNANGLLTLAATLNGGAGTDTLYGGPNADVIDGGDDNDTVFGGYGGDAIAGGNGDDILRGGAASVGAGPAPTDGDDTINGNAGDDDIDGMDGNDKLFGDDGADEIHGGAGDDLVEGGDGNDATTYDYESSAYNNAGLYGDIGNDTVNGGNGIDYANGGAGTDLVNGDAGDDAGTSDYYTYTYGGVHGGDDNDTVNGGSGVDYVNGDNGDDNVNGDAGNDTWQQNSCLYAAAKRAAQAAPSQPQANGCFGSSGGVYGGAGNDIVHGNDGNDYIGGYYGDDSVAEPDNDHLYGDAGNDYMSGDGGDDYMEGNAGDDRMYGYAGNDTMDGGDGHDGVNGGNDNDIVNGGAGDDAPGMYANLDFSPGLYGGNGDDQIDGGSGTDYATGGDGNDTINGGDGRDALTYVDCPQEMPAAAVNLCQVVLGGLSGGSGDDTINGGADDDFIDGGDGNDNIDGGAGNDRFDLSTQSVPPSASLLWVGYPGLYGGDGDDTVHGGDGNDYLNGGWGVDTTNGDAGDDQTDEWADGSADTASGGDGADHLWYSSCCEDQPVKITLDGQADDGQAPSSDPKGDQGDPNNNFGSDLENVQYITDCSGNTTVCWDTTGTSGAPATIVGNSSANLIWGSFGNDDITGGDGPDYLSGGYTSYNYYDGISTNVENNGPGDDTFHARDGWPDYVDCGDGTDTAIVDQFDTVRQCENVDRANVASAYDTSKPPVVVIAPQAPPVAPDKTPPNLNLTVPKTTFTAEQFVLGVKVSFTCNEDCALNLRLLAQQASGTATFARAKGYNVVVGRRTVGFGKNKRNIKVRPCERKQGGPQSQVCLKRFKKALNARLAKSGKVTMKLRGITTDRAGNRTVKVKTITIKRSRR